MNILSWDLETSNLNADYGVILCAGYKTVGKGSGKVISVQDYEGDILRREKALLKDLCVELLTADCWLTWFGTYFDIPFVNSRLLYHNLPTLPANFTHIDGWKVSRNRLKLRNNRLNTVQEFLGTKTAKDAVLGPVWIKALAGCQKSLRYIINHCKKDIKALDEVYQRLRPLILDHPHVGLVGKLGSCGVCGGDKLQARGFRLTRTRKYQRYQCQSCGSWSSSTKPIAVSRHAV